MHKEILHEIKLIIHTSRPLYWLVHFLFFVFGVMASGHFTGFSDVRFILPIAILTLPYSYFIYAVNDYYDDTSDHANSRKGGVFGAIHSQHSRSTLLSRSVFCFLMGAVLFSFFGTTSYIVYLLLSADLFWYSAPPLRFKRIPFFDFLTGGTLYGGLMYLLGYSVYGGDLGSLLQGLPQNLIFICVITAFYHMVLAIFDITADKEQGISTTPVVLGAQKTLMLTLFILMGSLYFFASKPNFFIDIVVRSVVCILLFFPKLRSNRIMQKVVGEYSLYYSFVITLIALFINPLSIN